MTTTTLAELIGDMMSGPPPFRLKCGECGAEIGPSATGVVRHFETHGWRMIPGIALPVTREDA